MKFALISRLFALGFAAAVAMAALNAQAADEKKPPSMGTKPAAGATAAPKSLPAAERMDVNSATEAQLATLDGIGEARAKAIVKGRPYSGKDDLVKKKVIPEGVYEKIKDQIVARQK